MTKSKNSMLLNKEQISSWQHLYALFLLRFSRNAPSSPRKSTNNEMVQWHRNYTCLLVIPRIFCYGFLWKKPSIKRNSSLLNSIMGNSTPKWNHNRLLREKVQWESRLTPQWEISEIWEWEWYLSGKKWELMLRIRLLNYQEWVTGW